MYIKMIKLVKIQTIYNIYSICVEFSNFKLKEMNISVNNKCRKHLLISELKSPFDYAFQCICNGIIL